MFKELIIKGEAISHLNLYEKFTKLDDYKKHLNENLDIKKYISSDKIFDDITFFRIPEINFETKRFDYKLKLYANFSENELIDLETMKFVDRQKIIFSKRELELFYMLEYNRDIKKYEQTYRDYDGKLTEYHCGKTSKFEFRKDETAQNLVYNITDKNDIVKIYYLEKLIKVPHFEKFYISDFKHMLHKLDHKKRINVYRERIPFIENNKDIIIKEMDI